MKYGVVGALIVALVTLVTYFFASGKPEKLGDCELARIWYEIDVDATQDIETFADFLETVIRIGESDPGGLFSDMRYSIAVRYPASKEVKIYDFSVSRKGTPHSQMSLSSLESEWLLHRKINCDGEKEN